MPSMISLIFVPFKYFDVNRVAKQLKIRERRRTKSMEIAEEPASGSNDVEMQNLGIQKESSQNSSEEGDQKISKNLKVYDPDNDEEFASDEDAGDSHIEETFC